MPVLFPTILAQHLFPVAGVTLGHAQAGIKKSGRDDCLLIMLDEKTSVAGVFTQNRFCAAPVQLCQSHLQQMEEEEKSIRALVINTGCANAGTGEKGLIDAHNTCAAVATLIGCAREQVLPFSTGVIMEHLPMEKLLAALPRAYAQQMTQGTNWYQAAGAIMTTDTLPKASSIQLMIEGQQITITGISKGAGMIAPNMATMLGFIATDAHVPPALLRQWCTDIAAASFNAITIDGDTSTNDSFVMMATGKYFLSTAGLAQLRPALLTVASTLAQLIVRDAEGATKFITVQIEGGKNTEECRQIARAIAHSPLVKTAFFASDPNLGRILATVGYAGISDLNTQEISLYLNDLLVAEHGGRANSYQESAGKAIMEKPEITVRLQLNRGSASYRLWTCDLSDEYVRINADYRS